MGYILGIILLVLNLLNVLFHSIGAYLLISMYTASTRKTQQIYLINLSISECMINLLEMCRIICTLIPSTSSTLKQITEIRHYTLIVSFTGISVVYYFVMIYLTVHKLLEIELSIRYPLYWDERKAKYLLISTWIFAFISCATVSALHNIFDFQWQDPFFKYFYVPIEFAFIILALTTYGFIFFKYRQSQLKMPGGMVTTQSYRRRRSTVEIFQQSRFSAVLLLIVTFLFFMVVPDIVYLFVAILYDIKSEILLTACWISYAISNLVDAYIYIFMQHDVRHKLWTVLRSCCDHVNQRSLEKTSITTQVEPEFKGVSRL